MKSLASKFHASIYAIIMVIALSIFVSSCEKEEMAVPDEQNSELKDITQVLESYGEEQEGDDGYNLEEGEDNLKSGKFREIPTFNTLLVALVKTNLLGTVAKNRLTVFAPSDKAFAKLGLNPRNIGSVPNLKQILLYHVISKPVFSFQLSNGFVPTLNGAAVEIKLNDGVMVNNAKVTIADIRALNGVIHVIDNVLFPPTKNLVELALGFNPEFSILVAAVQKAGLVETLATGGPFTVFAPTNDAFVSLLGELGATSLDDIDAQTLKNVLLYHVVSGRVFSSDLKSGPVTSLNGNFSVNLSTLKITDARNRQAGLVTSLLNIQATNGVIHVIDRVILP